MRSDGLDRKVPGFLVIGAGALIGFTLLAVGLGRTGGVAVPEAKAAQPVQSVALRVDDQADGSITLRDVGSDHLLVTVMPGQDGFLRGTLRAFAQARLREGLTREQPFRLTRFDDGSLELGDDATGRRVNLGAFGPTNLQAFARIMPETGAAR